MDIKSRHFGGGHQCLSYIKFLGRPGLTPWRGKNEVTMSQPQPWCLGGTVVGASDFRSSSRELESRLGRNQVT